MSIVGRLLDLLFPARAAWAAACEAAQSGDARRLRGIAETTPKVLSMRDKDGHALAHYATTCGNADCLRIVADMNPESLRGEDYDDDTPANIAAVNGYAECLKVVADAAPELLAKENSRDYPPAHEAARHGHADCLRVIADVAPDLFSRVRNGYTPAHRAVMDGHAEALDVIAKTAPDTMSVKDESMMMTPAHLATMGDHAEVLRVIARIAPETMSSADLDDRTPAHLAAMRDHAEALKVIAKTAPEAMSITDLDNRTPAQVASEMKACECLRIIENLGLLNAPTPDHNRIAPDVGQVQVFDGMEMVWCPPGTFKMGSFLVAEESPPHEVTLTKGFWIGKFVVTKAQWKAVMGNEPWNKRGKQEEILKDMDSPAVCVSWDEAQRFAEGLGQAWRLPTEAEWEYACRAGTTTDYSFGEDYHEDIVDQLSDYAWISENAAAVGKGFAHRVGQKQPNPWGLYDMYGNVNEWCQDMFDDYRAAPVTDPLREETQWDIECRVVRGHSWFDPSGWCRSAKRDRNHDYHTSTYYGFRVVRDE